MLAYFEDEEYDKLVAEAQTFGMTEKNELWNGRWAMLGFGIGLLTEYATGVDFPTQLRIILSYTGIADVY